MSLLSDFTRKFIDTLSKLKDTSISNPQQDETLVYNSTTEQWENSTLSGGHTIEDEGVPLTQRDNLNFVGDSVTVTDDAGNNATVVTISGTGGGTSATNASIINRLFETITTVKDTFNIQYSIIDGTSYVDVWLNGVKLAPTEFVASDGSTIILNQAVDGVTTPNQTVEIVAGYAAGADDISVSVSRAIYSYTATDGQTTFEANYVSKEDIDFFYEGHRLDPEEYTANDGSTIVLNVPAVLGDSIEIVTYKGVSDTANATKSDAKKLAIIFG